MRRLGRYFAWYKEEGGADDLSWEPDYSDPFWRWVGQRIENRFDYSKMDYSMMQLFLAGGRNKDDTIPSDTHL